MRPSLADPSKLLVVKDKGAHHVTPRKRVSGARAAIGNLPLRNNYCSSTALEIYCFIHAHRAHERGCKYKNARAVIMGAANWSESCEYGRWKAAYDCAAGFAMAVLACFFAMVWQQASRPTARTWRAARQARAMRS